ncbi:hypothetical protein IT568_03155 [bacterium]|nr:hypothetical protein [bacterium]
MQISNELFNLIKALDKPEKRYFKIYASRHVLKGESIQIELFDAIDSLETYDEEKIIEKFRDKNFVKHISTTKNKLYSLVLKSLDAYYSSNPSVEVEIREMLNQTEVLKKKKLYEQAFKILAKAKKIAKTYEKTLELLKIFDLETKLFLSIPDLERMKNYLSKDCREELNLIEIYKNYFDFKLSELKVFLLRDKEGFKNEANFKSFEEIFESNLFRNEKNALSFEAKFHFYNIVITNFIRKGDSEKALEFLTAFAGLWKKETHQIKEMPLKYLGTLHNYVIFAIDSGKIPQAKETINLMKNIFNEVPFNPELEVTVFQMVTNLEFLIGDYTLEFEEQYKKIPEIEKALQKFSGKINKLSEIFILTNVALLCFTLEDYSKSLDWTNRVLNTTESNLLKEEIHCELRILKLLIHYELGDYNFLEHAAKSTQRFLEKKGKLFTEEEIVLEFFTKKLPNSKNKTELHAAFLTLKEKLLKFWTEKNKTNSKDFLQSWLESKIQNKKISQFLRENLNS